VAAIGPATAEALAARGIRADLVPTEYVAEAVVEAMKAHLRPGTRVLIPRAEDAREELPEGLGRLGVEVDEVTLYRAAVPGEAPAQTLEALRRGEIDIVTFTSSSTVRNLVAMLGGVDVLMPGPSPVCGRGEDTTAGAPLVACIGPITAETARDLGLRVDVEAAEHTVEGLVEALTDPLNRQAMAKRMSE
jgi:uroporphyrinogen-III synthase